MGPGGLGWKRDQEQSTALGTPGIEQEEKKAGVLWSYGVEFKSPKTENQLERILEYSTM